MTLPARAIAWKYLSVATRQFLEDDGYMALCAIKYGATIGAPSSIKERFIKPREEIKPTIDWAEKWNKAGYNIYMSWALFSEKARTIASGIKSAAYIADWDGDDPEVVDNLSPTLTVETSPGHYQEVYAHKPMDVKVAGDLYKKLARRFGCDIHASGDPVHLWRVPGTINYPQPKKKRGPSESKWNGKVNGKVVFSQVRDEGKNDARDERGGEWPDRRPGKSLDGWITRELRRKHETGERSEVFHKLVLAMGKLGWGIEDIADKMRNTSLGEKYGKRLSAEIERSLGKSDLDIPDELGDLPIIWYNPRDTERDIRFLWYPYLPLDEVTILDGDGGIGKTSLMLRIAQAVMVGDEMPNGEKILGGGKVLYVSLEADYEGVTLPTLKRMGMLESARFAHLQASDFTMDDQGMERLVRTIGANSFNLVVIDSLVDFLPDDLEMNDYKESSKWVLKLRARIALRFSCAVVVLRHNAKGAKEKLAYKGMGSMGWAKGSRSQLVVREDPEVEGQFNVVHAKHSMSKKGPSLVYQFKEVKGRGLIEWVGVSEITDEELNEKKPDANRRTKLAECLEWLRDLLEGKGPVKASWVFEQAEGRSFNRRLVQRASSDLAIDKAVMRVGKGTDSTWTMRA